MDDTNLLYTPATELARRLRRRQLSPVELIEALLRRIEALNPKLNAYLTVAAGEALAQARDAEGRIAHGGDLPPLIGMPVSIKDLIMTRGMRTTGGSLLYRDWTPEEDAAAVERLRAAGAIIVGKTNTPEFGLAATTENRLGDDCRNPWGMARTSGGSSGGAASSVAAGMGPLALGSDGGGSIRIPSSLCGVFGFKPTFGTVPAHGGFSGMPLFSHLGTITRTVADAALMLDVIAGYDRRDPRSRRERAAPTSRGGLGRGVKGLRVAWSSDLGFGAVDPEVLEIAAASARLFESLGCAVEDATPEADPPFGPFGQVVGGDGYAVRGHLLGDPEKAGLLTDYTRRSLERGREVTATDYSKALRALETFRARMADFFERYDLLLTPATAVPAYVCRRPPSEVAGQPVGVGGPLALFTLPFNVTGQPAASVPCGFTSEGLPAGVQIVGRAGEDLTVLRAAAAFEQAQPWADRRPAL